MQPLTRSQALLTIPKRKIIEKQNEIIESCETCRHKITDNLSSQYSGLCQKCSLFVIAFNRYAETNIPVEHWSHEDYSFKGNEFIQKLYNDAIKDIPGVYKKGSCVCFAGPHGTFKTTLVSGFLKKAVLKNYSCLYTTLSDIVSVLTSGSGEDKYLARKDLLTVDFLVIDEFDSRFMATEFVADLFGRVLENIFRTRAQNKLPIFMCTNSPNVTEIFTGPIKESLSSLISGYVKIVPVIGPDQRKIK